MACNIVRNSRNEIALVYKDNGQVSTLYSTLKEMIPSADVAYGAYLTALAQSVDPNSEPSVSEIQPLIYDALANPNTYMSRVNSIQLEQTQDAVTEALTDLLDKIGVNIVTIQEASQTGDVLGYTDLAQKVVAVAKNSKQAVFDEEVIHVLVELLRETGSPLYESMSNLIENYDVFEEVMDASSEHYKKYNGDPDLLRREAIAQAVQQHVMGAREEKDASLIGRLKRWWDRVMKWIGQYFSAVNDPYIQAAEMLLNKTVADHLNQIGISSSNLNNFQFEANDILYSVKENPQEQVLELFDKYDQFEVKQDIVVGNNKYWQKLGEDGMIARYVGKPGTEFADIVLEIRMSDAGTLEYQKKYKPIYTTKEEKEEFERLSALKMAGGERIHKAMEDLVLKRLGKIKKSEVQIQTEAGLTAQDFSSLARNAKGIVQHILQIQKSIDPKGKIAVRTEQFVLNKARNAGGKIDLVVIFSDGSGLVYDYKTTTPSLRKDEAYYNRNGTFTLKADPWADSINQYDAQLSNYKEALVDMYGVTHLRESRVIPIAVSYKRDAKKNPTGEIAQLKMGGDFFGITNTQMTEEEKKFFDPIPVAGEKTGIESIDELIDGEMRRLARLQDKLKDATYKNRQQISEAVKRSRWVLRQLQLQSNLEAGVTEAWRIIKRLNIGLGQEHEYDPITGEFNTKYLTNEELIEMYDTLKHYQAFLEVSESEIELIRKKLQKGPKWKEGILNTLDKTSKINRVVGALKMKMIERAQDFAKENGVEDITKFRKMDYWTSNLTSLSSHANPIQRTLFNVMDTINTKALLMSKELANQIAEEEEMLLQWGERNGLYGPQVYDKIINPDTHNLHPKYTPQLRTDREAALELEDINWVLQNYEIDEAKYEKRFKNHRDYVFKIIDAQEINDTQKKKQKEKWLDKNDVKRNKKMAWLNPANHQQRGYLKLNESAEQAYMSPAFAEILRTPELKRFYNFHFHHMSKFIEMYGIDKGGGFIANVQKGIVDVWIENGWDMRMLTEAGLDVLQLRQHDLGFGVTDTDGTVVRRIPRLYTRENYNSEGIVDNSLKSKDLGRSLYLFGTAAFKYKLTTEVMPTLLMMETLLKEKILKPLEEDASGQLIVSGNETRTQVDNSTVTTFTDSLDMTIFGRSLKSTGATFTAFGKTMSTEKTILGLKQYYTISTLGLRAPVALGALGAGIVGLQVQASKGIFFDHKTLLEAEASYARQDPKLRALMEFFDLSLEDMMARRGDLLSASYRGKYMNTDRWFEMLARADKTVDAILAVAMAKNYGINPKTKKLQRLKELPEGTKSIYDIIEVTDNPKYTAHSAKNKYLVTLPDFSQEKVKSKLTKEKKEALEALNTIKLNNFRGFKNKLHTLSRKVKGTMDPNDRMLFNYGMMGKLFLHYRSWLPGLAFERFGRLRYDYVMEHYDEGTWRSLMGNIGADKTFDSIEQALNSEIVMTEHLMMAAKDLMAVAVDIGTFGMTNTFKIKEGLARAQFDNYLLEQHGNPTFEGLKKGSVEYEAEFQKFLELKRGNIRGILSEMRAVFLLALAMFAMGGDWDEDGEIDIRQTWAGRKGHQLLHRVYREVGFFMDPAELTGPRASGIPLIGLAQQIYKWSGNTLDELGDAAFGEDSSRDRKPVGYHTFQFLPGIHGLGKLVELFPQHKYAQT